MEKLILNVRNDFGIKKHKGHHSNKSRNATFASILEQIHQKSATFKYIPGREYQAFQTFCRNIFQGINRKSTHQWIKKHKRKWHRQNRFLYNHTQGNLLLTQSCFLTLLSLCSLFYQYHCVLESKTEGPLEFLFQSGIGCAISISLFSSIVSFVGNRCILNFKVMVLRDMELQSNWSKNLYTFLVACSHLDQKYRFDKFGTAQIISGLDSQY